MTPSELRDLADEVHVYCPSRASGELKCFIDKLTDPTPITQEFAERVDNLPEKRTLLNEYPQEWQLQIFHPENSDVIHDSIVETVGQVNTLLWRAGLLEQMDGE